MAARSQKGGPYGQDPFIEIKTGAVGRHTLQAFFGRSKTHETTGNFLKVEGKVFTSKAWV